MPCCCVKICGNRSNEANFRTCGVTYHIFPKDPILRAKWIEACGRKDSWSPTHNSAVCSSHFEERWFQPLAKSRRLFPAAVPTLKLRMVFETPSKKSTERKRIIKPDEKKDIVERYKVQIERYKKGMQQHKSHILRLQTMVRRYRKKADVMRNILTALKNENAIDETHLWLLESDGITI